MDLAKGSFPLALFVSDINEVSGKSIWVNFAELIECQKECLHIMRTMSLPLLSEESVILETLPNCVRVIQHFSHIGLVPDR